jgi:hypothetical protein
LPEDPAARAARIRAELDELERTAPPDTTRVFHRARADVDRHRADRRALEHGTRAHTPAGRAARLYNQARQERLAAERRAEAPGVGWRERRRAARTAQRLAGAEALGRDDWDTLVEPALHRLDRHIADAESDVSEALKDLQFRQRWIDERPAYTRQVDHLERELLRIEDHERAELLDQLDRIPVERTEALGHERGQGLGL